MVYLQSDLRSLRHQLVYKWVLHEDNCRRQTMLFSLISLA